MSRIHVNIDRVVLHGVDPDDRHALVRGMQAELSRLLGQPDARAGWGESRRTPVMRLGSLRIEPGRTGAQRFGQSVAGGIIKGVGR
jgi:hypothetical protein